MPVARIFTMKRLIHKLVTIITLFILPYALANAAGCVPNSNLGKTVYLPVDNIIIQSDESIPVNTILKSYEVYTYPVGHPYYLSGGTCNFSFNSQYLNGWDQYASNKIAQTNINGIGIRAAPMNKDIIGYSVSFTTSPIHANGKMSIPGGYNWNVYIIKTGPISNANGQTIKAGPFAEFYTFDYTIDRRQTISKLAIPNNFRIIVASCTINGSNDFNINLGDWFDTKFNKIGDVSNNIDIPISLSCIAGTNIKVTVTSDNIDDAANGRIGLTGIDKATGIAVQLLNNAGVAITLNQQITQRDNTAQGNYIFGWKARYIKTAATVTPGIANANATVNITYE